MTELGYVTLPRGRRLPPTPNGVHPHHSNNNCNNGHLPNANHPHNNTITTNNFINNLINGHALFQVPTTVPISNGVVGGSCVVGNGTTGVRAIHDGFATIRSGGNKRGRSRSSPSVTLPAPASTPSPCHHPCCHAGTSPTWTMEPLWEERGGGEAQKATVARRDRTQLPWWEVATRRSRYRSCPAFTQASMVSALEQTMTSVTDRLERLASSPDLKETEAAELRKTAAVLRQQSSAVCQSVSSVCHPMERQLSCDSVSSVTSTVSGASMSSYASLGSHSLSAALTPHCSHLNHTQSDATNATSQAKLKKRSWLRSSFRRAFGRHGRKRKQGSESGTPEENPQELPLHHTVNNAVRHLPVPPPWSTLQPSGQSNKKQGQPKLQRQQNVFEESELLSLLHQEIGEKERALTEARLEVLSAQHQLQAQTDTIVKLQTEVVGLREENKRLVTLMRGEHGPPSAEPLLSTLNHTFSSLTLKPPTGKGIGVLSQREDGRRVKIVLVNQPGLASISQASNVTLEPQHLTHIGNISVGSRTTWDELDTKIIHTLKDYGNCVDPVSALGLDSGGCLLCYRVERVVCGPSLPRPELLPCGYCVGNIDSLHVWLKGVHQKRDGENLGSLSATCFSSLTPASSLTPLASLLLSHPRLVLAGPPATGKTHLALTLAKLLVENSGRKPSEDNIRVFKVTGTNSLELCQFLSGIWPRGLSTSTRSTSSLSCTPSTLSCTSSTSTLSANSPAPSPTVSTLSSAASTLSAASITSNVTNVETSPVSPPAVIILDDLHAAGGVVETLQRCLPTTIHTGPAIIATCCPTATLSTRLQIHCNFRWMTLSTQQEPVRGLLGRVLRRKVAAAEVAANTRLPDAHHLAEWLTRLWMHLNTLMSGHCGSNDVGLGPGLLIDCPLGQEETQVWFTEVWNSRLVPYIISTVRASATATSTLLETWTDPLDWVLATYPWPNNASCGPDQLTRIPASDIRQKEGSLSLSRSTASHRPYVPFSVHQQNHTSESVYAVPQVLPRPPPAPASFTASHETSQAGLTSERSGNNHITGQMTTGGTIGRESNMVKENRWCNSSQEKNDSLATIRRARSKSCTTNGPKPLTLVSNSNGQDINGDQIVVKPGPGNKKLPIITVGRLNNGTRSQENISNQGTTIITPAIVAGEKIRNTISDDVKVPLEDEDDVVMEIDCLMDNVSDNTDESDLQSVRSADSRHHNLNLGSKTDFPMDTDCKLKSTGPQSLDILAENVLNNNGLDPDCVKIIRGGRRKLELRGLAHELTTTFKPVESAI